MAFAATSIDIALPSWYGSASMGLLCASTVAWMVTGNHPSWKPASNVLIVLCNLNAIFLIVVLQKALLEEDDKERKEVGPDEDSSDQGSSYRRENSEPSDDEGAVAKNATKVPDSLLDKQMEKLVATVWKPQLLLTALLSAIVFWDSYNETNLYYLSLQSLMSAEDWHRSLYLLSNGAFLACLLLFTLRRKFSGSLLVPTTAAVLLSIACLTVAAWLLIDHRKAELNQIQQVLAIDTQSTSSNKITSYQGEAHVRGVSLLDERFCMSVHDALRVQVDVQWGGSWGCPRKSSTYCEATIESVISCRFWNAGEHYQTDDDSIVNQFDKDPLNYVLYRYQDSYDGISSFDDDSFDVDEAPEQPIYWNHPSEYIVGNCENCEARSWTHMMMDFHQLTRTLHQIFLSIGAGLFGVGWLVATLVQSQHQRTVATSNDGGRTTPLV
uniref:Transmembrane protein n=1 Tax=Amphora coffeiformis TaxID=265554 RepID=A0A7S3P3N2_9STRA|mmetsp:Transcript_14785/g.28006  ORF Transcript_14785/g.28006 Transcript_14785/m.28006 type:complete len:439 (+) Transcript_14785:48-1364(+)|eukprot:scaffold2849_cov174-Amphora_coffeaeformis.AAC.13